MIPIDRLGMDHHLMTAGDLTDQLTGAKINIPNQNRIAILRHPHDVVFTIPHRMTARFRCLHRWMLRIPSPEGEGFTDPRIENLNAV